MDASRRALALASIRGDYARVGTIENNLGDLLRQRGRFTEAVGHYEASMAVRADAPRERAETQCNLGRALDLLGDEERARIELLAAAHLADSLADPKLQATVQINLSDVFSGMNDAVSATRAARAALSAASASGDSSLTAFAALALGDRLLTQRDIGSAEPLFTRALDAMPPGDRETRIRTRLERGICRNLTGRLDEAEAEFHEAFAQAVELGSGELELLAQTNLGDVSERRGDYSEAFTRYGRALETIDTLRALQRSDRDAVKALGARRFVFDAMIHLLGKLDRAHPDSGFAERAFGWAEKARSRELLNLTATRSSGVRAGRTIGLGEAQRLLGTRDALLEYSAGDSSTSLWVIRHDRWMHATLPPREALRARVTSLRRALSDSSRADDETSRRASRALYRMLVGPAEPLLADVDHMIVSPDGPLAFVPFEALIPSGTNAEPAHHYLVNRFAVSYTPSASALALEERSGLSTSRESRAVVAVGDPAFGPAPVVHGEPLPRLPFTRLEVEALRPLCRGRDLRVLSGDSASASRLVSLAVLSRAEVIHLATHGNLDESEPERSGLWFAPEAPAQPPSRLEVADIMRLSLDADLVTLSACETGLGRLERGEGVIGLTRAFLSSGAHSVIVSLWEVSDRSTAQLMTRFYRGALLERRDRSEALARAKRALIASAATRSPFHWAPFVLVGARGPLP